MEVLNHDIIGIYNRMNRFLVEIFHANSANTSRANQFDVVRAKSYLSAIRTYHDYVMAQPQLDLPESGPTTYPLEDPPAVPKIENESFQDLCRLIEVSRYELINSQSARIPSGLISFDSRRLMAVVAKAENFITSYIETATPLDLPESSPMAPLAEKGKLGI